jgi:thioredoxin:protein disulfide reductase
MKKMLILTLALASPLTVHATDPLSSMNAWVEGQLSAHSGSAMAFVFLFLGGLLASLLPCVYPLYPITASIVKGRRNPVALAGRIHWPIFSAWRRCMPSSASLRA